MNLEREVKLTVGPLFHLPDLSEVLDGFSAEGEGVQRFVTSYYDTQDLRLARWGCSLRYRTGDGWTVKLPATAFSDTLAREEHQFEAGPGRPPAPAIDLLRGYLRQEPVSLAVRLQTVRRTTRLLDAEAKPAAEVVDDEVSVLDGRRVVARFRELGGRAVSVGSDAHRPEAFAWALDEGYAAAAAAGFDALTFRRGGAPVSVALPIAPNVGVGRSL